MEIISRKQAEELNFKKYFTGNSCEKCGEICDRYVTSGECSNCKYLVNKSDEKKAYAKTWQKNNMDKSRVEKS
jgi:hypothetical protein